MAQHETDRENLLRDATAFRQRVEWHAPPPGQFVFCGVRPDHSVAWHFGPDLVLQFNSHRQLRRAYREGRLVVATAGALVWLDRKRTATATNLIRTPLTAAEQAAFLKLASERLQWLAAQLAAGTLVERGHVPQSEDVVAVVRQWLSEMTNPLTIAAQPHVS